MSSGPDVEAFTPWWSSMYISVKGRDIRLPGFPEKSCSFFGSYTTSATVSSGWNRVYRWDHGCLSHTRNHSHRSCIDEEIGFPPVRSAQCDHPSHEGSSHILSYETFFCHGSGAFPVTAGRTCKNMDAFCTLQGRTGRRSPFRHADAHNGDGAPPFTSSQPASLADWVNP